MDLSGSLAQLLEAYEFHRFELVESWWENSASILEKKEIDADSIEEQSAFLYLCAQANLEALPACGLFQLSRQLPYESGQTQSKTPVYLIGFSQVSRFHIRLLDQLRDYNDFHFFTLNPCQEYWEDLETPRENSWRRRKEKKLALPKDIEDPLLLETQGLSPLLSLWGRPGREGIRLQCQLTDCDFQDYFEDPASQSRVLDQVQASILNFSSNKAYSSQMEPDDSLVIFSAPTREREVEAVYNSIMFELDEDSHLSQSDIAILVPDLSSYRPVLEDVFSRQYPRELNSSPRDSVLPLSFNLVDMQADTESHYARAVLDLLDLAHSELDREALFRIISNPCFQERWEIKDEDIQYWTDWLDHLGSYRGFDERDFSFRSGISRLVLSLVLPGSSDSNLGESPEFGGHPALPQSITLEPTQVETFARIVETIYKSSRNLLRQRSGSDWVHDLRKVLEELFEIPPSARGESAVQSGFLGSLDSLRHYSSLSDAEDDGSEDEAPENAALLDFDLVALFLRDRLRGISGGTGDYLVRGITISALQPMRPIPFKIIYILGLNEDSFPGRNEESSLDLRLGSRCFGDLTPPERNRYLFLEILLSARHSLRLGFLGRDLKKDRILHKSPVLEELSEVLGDYPVVQIPLHRFERSECQNWDGGLLREVSPTEQLCAERRQKYAQTGSVESEFLSPHGYSMGLEDQDKPQDFESSIPENLNLSQLRAYLINPWIEHARIHHRFDAQMESLEEAWMENTESIQMDALGSRPLMLTRVNSLLREFFEDRESQTLPDLDPLILEKSLIHEHEILQRRGLFPSQFFAPLDQSSQLDCARSLLSSLRETLESYPIDKTGGDCFRSLLIGEASLDRGDSSSDLVRRLPPLELEVAPSQGKTTVRLSGKLDWCWKSSDEAWHCLGFHNSGETKAPHHFNPVLGFLLAVLHPELSADFSNKLLKIHILTRAGVSEFPLRLSPEFAREYLDRLICEILNPALPPYLPAGFAFSIKLRLPKSQDSDKTKLVSFFDLQDWHFDCLKPLVLRLETGLSENDLPSLDMADFLFRSRFFEALQASLDDEGSYSMQPTALERMLLERELKSINFQNARILPQGCLGLALYRLKLFSHAQISEDDA